MVLKKKLDIEVRNILFGGKYMRVITLCGSTKFKKQFREAEANLTLQGNIILSLGFFEQSEGIQITKDQEKLFEELHYRKIDMSDEIFVIDVDGYIGLVQEKKLNMQKVKGKILAFILKQSFLQQNNVSHYVSIVPMKLKGAFFV
jgi:hypothetical protein